MKNGVKNRHRVILYAKDNDILNNIQMLLSSHGYLVDTVKSFEDLSARMINYKPSILIADVDLLPESTLLINDVFNKAKKKPVFLIINSGEDNLSTQRYLKYGVDDILTIPFNGDKLYRKVKRAAEYNHMQHLVEYHSGMLFMLKLISPIILVFLIILANKGL